MISVPSATIDAIAQNLCRVRGLDPWIIVPYDGHNSQFAGQPYWHSVRPEVVRYLEMREALAAFGVM